MTRSVTNPQSGNQLALYRSLFCFLQSYPHAKPHAAPRFDQPGFFSLLRASSPRSEPGDLAFLGEAVPFTDRFSAQNRLKRTVSGRPPTRQASASSVDPHGRCQWTDPDCQRCALAIVPAGLGRVPSLLSATASQRHAWPECRLPLPRVLGDPVGRHTGLAIALAVGVFAADACGRRRLPALLRRPYEK